MTDERFQPKLDGHPNFSVCYDQVGDKILSWLKGIGPRSGEFMLHLIDPRNDNQWTNFLGIKTDRSGRQIWQVEVVANLGNIKLIHDPVGVTTVLRIFDDYEQLEPSQITMEIAQESIIADAPTGSKISQATNCLRIFDPSGCQRLFLEPQIDTEFIVSSSLWDVKEWSVDIKPIEKFDLALLSPGRWGDSILAPAMVQALTNILQAKVRPLS